MTRFAASVRLAFGVTIMAGTAALGGTAALAAPAGAATPPEGSCYFYDNVYNEPGACEDEALNYTETGVSVWNSPYSPSTVVAVSSAGDFFASSETYVSDGAAVTCDSGVTTNSWYQGEDKASGNLGWVPDCYLNGEPS